MQYIQFQPQIAVDVTNPESGNVNFFVDVVDNLVKTKDSEGTIFGGYKTLITCTKAEIDSIISGNTLVAGQFYSITDVNPDLYGGTNIILQAISGNTLSKRGFGLFYNPKYTDPNNILTGTYYTYNNQTRVNITDTNGFFQPNEQVNGSNGETAILTAIAGSSTITFVEASGDWSASTNVTGNNSGAIANISSFIQRANYNIGDKVIYGGFVYVNLTGSVGFIIGEGIQQLDTQNWAVVPYNTSDYNLVADIIEYEYEYDNISYRKNETNEVTANYTYFSNEWGFNNIMTFPWGNPVVNFVSLYNTFTVNLINFPNQTLFGPNLMQSVICKNGSAFDANNWGFGSIFTNIEIGELADFYSSTFGDNSFVQTLKINSYASVVGINTANNDNGSDQINKVELANNATFTNISIYDRGFINNVVIEYNGTFNTIFLYGGNINQVKIGDNSEFSNLNLDSSSSISNIILLINSFFNNHQLNTSTITDILIGNNSSFNNITTSSNGGVVSISNMTIGAGANVGDINFLFGGVTISNIDIDSGGVFNNITLNINSLLEDIKIFTNGAINGLTLNPNSNMTNCSIGVASSISTIMVNNGIIISGIEVGTAFSLSTINFSENNFDSIINTYKSTFIQTLDITNATTIDLTNYNYVGTFMLTSSNSAETINAIFNISNNFPQTFVPAIGLTVTFTGTSIGSLSQNAQLVMPTSNFVTNGSNLDTVSFIFNSTDTYYVAKLVDSKNYI